MDCCVVNLSPKQGVLSASNVLGTGFTMYKNWEISVDLRLKQNANTFFSNVFQFIGKVRKQVVRNEKTLFCFLA